MEPTGANFELWEKITSSLLKLSKVQLEGSQRIKWLSTFASSYCFLRLLKITPGMSKMKDLTVVWPIRQGGNSDWQKQSRLLFTEKKKWSEEPLGRWTSSGASCWSPYWYLLYRIPRKTGIWSLPQYLNQTLKVSGICRAVEDQCYSCGPRRSYST